MLAEKLLDTKTKNLAIRALLATSRERRSEGSIVLPGITCAKIIYEGTPQGSRGRKLFVDFYFHRGNGAWISKQQNWPADFLYELSVALLDKRECTLGYDPTKTGDAKEYFEV